MDIRIIIPKRSINKINDKVFMIMDKEIMLAEVDKKDSIGKIGELISDKKVIKEFITNCEIDKMENYELYRIKRKN